MLNSFMQIVHTKVHESLNDKSMDFIKKKAQSLGIENKQFYHKERLMFLISQHIAFYIDLHVQESKRLIKGFASCNINSILKKRNQMLDQNNNRNHSTEFVKATFLYYYICGPIDIYKSVRLIQQLQTQLLCQYEIQEITLEAFKENQQIKQISNERQFSCICKYQDSQESAMCEKCMKKFHPQCQYQKLVCNRCYLSHYFYPIESSFFSKFGQKRKTFTYFHSKFRCYNPNDQKKSQLFAIKFDIDDFQDLQHANQPQFIIKIMNFKSLGSDEQKSQKWRILNSKYNDYSMFINFNRFQFFLNFYQLRRKNLYFRDENSLIFKLENRMPKYKDNIFMIKCDPHFFQDETYEIGIYRISRIRNWDQNIERQFGINKDFINDELNKSIRITLDQHRLLKKFSKGKEKKLTDNVKGEIHTIKVNDDDDNQKDQKFTNFELVRSYGCNHKQGFNFAQLKRNHLQFIETSRQTHRNKDLKNHIQKLFQKQLFKQYKKHALKTNIKTEQNLHFNQNHIQSIKRYCIQHDLIKFIEIPQIQNFQKKLVNNQFKKYLGKYQIKNSKNKRIQKKNKNQLNFKQQKKYRKFAKCPICKNFLSVLYLLPFQLKQGQQIKISKSYRSLKKKKTQQSEQQARQSMLQMFKPKSIFRLNRNKKQQESQEDESQYQDENKEEEEDQDFYEGQKHLRNKRQATTPKILLSDIDHREIFQQSFRSHKIYITKNRQPSDKKVFQKQGDREYKIEYQFQRDKEELEQIEPQQSFHIIEQNGSKERIKESLKQVKVMSQQSIQSQEGLSLKIPQQNIIKLSESQSLQQLSFDSPIINYQQIIINPISKSKKINCQFPHNQANQNLSKEQLHQKKQFFSISDLQNQDIQNDQNNKTLSIEQQNPNKTKHCNKNYYEQKKQIDFHTPLPQKDIIQISLLSEDQLEQGQMKIQDKIYF